MKKGELEAIKRRAERASPGPWCVGMQNGRRWIGEYSDRDGCIGRRGNYYGENRLDEAAAEFIAAARSDVPALVAEVEKLRGLLESVETQLAFIALKMPGGHSGIASERILKQLREALGSGLV